MKKIISLIAVMVLCVGFVFATETTNEYTGIADFTGKGSADFSFTLKNVSNDAAATSLVWSSSDAFNTSDTVKWIRCDQYAVVAATITKANCKVYMYQKNTESTNYKAEEPRINADDSRVYSGLVNKVTKGGAYRGYVPVAYSLVPEKNSSITFDGTEGKPTDDRANRFFTDAADKIDEKGAQGSGFKKDYSLIAYSNTGVVFGPFDETGATKPWESKNVKNHTAYMYFFGGFANINGGDVYGTDKLLVIQDFE